MSASIALIWVVLCAMKYFGGKFCLTSAASFNAWSALCDSRSLTVILAGTDLNLYILKRGVSSTRVKRGINYLVFSGPRSFSGFLVCGCLQWL